MTSWYAIGVGLLVLVVGTVVGTLVPVLGQLGATLLAGVTAGYVAGGSLRRGAWHGFLTGVLPGVVVAVVFVLGLLLLDFAFKPIGLMAEAAGIPPTGTWISVAAASGFLLFVVAAFGGVCSIGGVLGAALEKV